MSWSSRRAADVALPTEHPVFRWSSPRGRITAWGTAARIEVCGPIRLQRAASSAEALLGNLNPDAECEGMKPIVTGALGFGDADTAELLVPQHVLRQDRTGTPWLTSVHGSDPATDSARTSMRTEAGPRDPGSLEFRDVQDFTWWQNALNTALAEIASGRLTKVVLARKVEVLGRQIDPNALFEKLRTRSDAERSGSYCYLVALAGGDHFVGAIPELLVERFGHAVRSRPLAGSAPHASDAPTINAAAPLMNTPRLLHEHQVVVDDLMSSFRAIGSVPSASVSHPLSAGRVVHLATDITALFEGPAPTSLALAASLHPSAAVGGMPRDAALAAIRSLEPLGRGPYASPVGWMDTSGDGEWTLGLRAARLHERGATLTVGCGIVSGSQPEDEWAETEWKLLSLKEALAAI